MRDQSTSVISARNTLLLGALVLFVSLLSFGYREPLLPKPAAAPSKGSRAPAPHNPLVLPKGFPMPPIPADNPVTEAKFELGRQLFYDKQLSKDNSLACASCHLLRASFSDSGKAVSIGVNGRRGARNAPTIVNLAYNTSFFWDGRARTLEEQAVGPILNPLELKGDTAKLPAKLASSNTYSEQFIQAFGDANITMDRIAKAIATFERCLISGDSPYDRFSRGDSSALSPAARRGMAIFNSPNTKCSTCHSGINFTDDALHSTGLYGFYVDGGRFGVTGHGSDYAKFRTPSLRNVALSPPYEHNGRFATLRSVLDHYNVGGKRNSTQDTLIRPLNLTHRQIADLESFLTSLTDTSFTNRKEFGPD